MAHQVLRDWPRRPHLEFYRRHPSPFYTVTFELDAAPLRRRARELGASTYAAMVWAYHRALLSVDAFRTRLLGEDVVLHDVLDVSLTVPAPRNTYSFAAVAWDPRPEPFLAAARAAMDEASRSVDLTGGDDPAFAYYTALPRLPFSTFVPVPLAEPTAGQTMTGFGKLRESDGRAEVPVSVTVNHCFVHGADLGALYEAARDAFAAGF
jgi:chloramphenicol O-acetyltransferase type A